MKKVIVLLILFTSTISFTQNGFNYYKTSYVNRLVSNNNKLKKSISKVTFSLDSLNTKYNASQTELNETIQSIKNQNLVLINSIDNYEKKVSEMEIPFYKEKFFEVIRTGAEYLYIYAVVPFISLLILYILFNFGHIYLFGKEKPIDNLKTFRRIISWLLPFFVSSYIILMHYMDNISADTVRLNDLFFEGDVYLLIGFVVGLIFIAGATLINFTKEFQINLVIFYSSLILFSLITAFMIFESFSSIRVIYGFIIGTSIYVFLFGIKNKNLLPQMNFFKNKKVVRKIV